MAERRMFAKTIIDSDAFLDMPLSTQALYFHLSMRADDEGFINNPKKIKRMIGASDDDLKLLIAKNFVIPFESGVVVIKHWRIHNYIRADRLIKTVYKDERGMLDIKENGAYTFGGHMSVKCQSTDGQLTDTCQSTDGQVPVKCQHRLGKDRLGKDSIGEVRLGEDKVEVIDNPAGSQESIPSLPILDGPEWRPDPKDIQEWQHFYKRVDILYELGRMRQWCINNPTKRKTAYEIRGFVTKWLDQEQRKTKGRQVTGADAYYEAAQEAMNHGSG